MERRSGLGSLVSRTMQAMDPDPSALDIVIHPAQILRQAAKPVEAVDDAVRAVIERMIDLMEEYEGIGLAAPQVGLPWRLFITRDPDEAKRAVVWINPELEVLEPDAEAAEEGCLSLPGVVVHVNRPLSIRIKGLDENGQPAQAISSEHIARVWQHENDHLDGVLIIDRMSSMDRIRNRRALRDMERG
ncbi:MAG: peptide deformylase [Phycisphaerae bacterium]|nr:peptide deformylase [Phycisphaerae bacterium]